MKVSVDDQELFVLSETQKKVIQNEIPLDVFEEDMRRRLQWILIDEKYRKCFERLKKEWDQKLADPARNIDSVPTNPDAYAELVFSQPDYKNRTTRDAEFKAQQEAEQAAALAAAQEAKA